MANTFRGLLVLPVAAATGYRFDQFASMIAAGSAYGYAVEPQSNPSLGVGSGAWPIFGVGSVAFPRAASLNQAIPANPTAPIYDWDTILMRSTATSLFWMSDPIGLGSAAANASVGIPLFGTDPRAVAFPTAVREFTAFANGTGVLTMIFMSGDELDL